MQASDRLKYSADILLERLAEILKDHSKTNSEFDNNEIVRSLLETNLLLLGYSIENALKALLICHYTKRKDLPDDCDFDFLEKEVWKTKKGHDLNALAKNTSLSITDEEYSLLTKLTKYSMWNGRYHIPKNAECIEKLIQPGPGDRHSSKDQSLFDNIISKIKMSINVS